MTIDPASSVAAADSQTSVLMLSKSLKLAQSTAAQLLQSLPAAGPTAPAGPPLGSMGQLLDTYA